MMKLIFSMDMWEFFCPSLIQVPNLEVSGLGASDSFLSKLELQNHIGILPILLVKSV